MGLELATPGSEVRLAKDSATLPGVQIRIINWKFQLSVRTALDIQAVGISRQAKEAQADME